MGNHRGTAFPTASFANHSPISIIELNLTSQPNVFVTMQESAPLKTERAKSPQPTAKKISAVRSFIIFSSSKARRVNPDVEHGDYLDMNLP
jgi:hypothetical protein